MFPGPTREYEEHQKAYGDTSRLSANQFFYGLRYGDENRIELERRVELLVGLEAISEPDKHGMRTVMCILNGQLRPAQVRDLSLDVTESLAEKAIPGNPKHIAAPFGGVVTIVVEPGATLAPGASIGSIEAMKMEAAIPAPAGGTVQRVAISSIASVEGGDLLIELQ